MNLKNKNGTRWGRVVEGFVAGGKCPSCAFNRKFLHNIEGNWPQYLYLKGTTLHVAVVLVGNGSSVKWLVYLLPCFPFSKW